MRPKGASGEGRDVGQIKGGHRLPQPPVQCRENRVTDVAPPGKHRDTRHPQHRVSESGHEGVPFPVMGAVHMLAAINFDHQPGGAAGEISDVGANRMLPHKLVATQLPVPEHNPQRRLRRIGLLPQGAGPRGRVGKHHQWLPLGARRMGARIPSLGPHLIYAGAQIVLSRKRER